MQERRALHTRTLDHLDSFDHMGLDRIFHQGRLLRLGGLLHEDARQRRQIVGHVQTTLAVVRDHVEQSAVSVADTHGGHRDPRAAHLPA